MLVAVGPPSVTISPSGPLYKREGESLSLECVAEGDPTPTVQWQTPSRAVEGPAPLPPHLQGVPGESTAQITISYLTAEDSGTYICMASNNMGRSEERITIMGRYTHWSTSSGTCDNV